MPFGRELLEAIWHWDPKGEGCYLSTNLLRKHDLSEKDDKP
jgi:hypothetical protein